MPLDSAAWPLIVVLGPTGAGKSELALVLAEAMRGEILNCDSIQVYRGLEIGSAKTPVSARRGIPHHLLDIIDIHEELTAGAYSHLAREVLAEVRMRNRVAILTGGTGFYLRALLDGLSPAPRRDEPLRARLGAIADRRPGILHRFLRAHDPMAALRIHPNDRQKLIRAVELMHLTAQPVSSIQSAPRNRLDGFAILKIGLVPERAALYEHLNQRAAAMFRSGLLEETKALLDCGVSPEAKPLESLGYKQVVQVLRGELRVEDAVRECQTKTRQYAKRQMTWFRAERHVEWLTGFGSDFDVQQQARRLVERFLAAHPAKL